jgi:hypothetical protein
MSSASTNDPGLRSFNMLLLVRRLTALERKKLLADGDKLSRANTSTAYNPQLKKFEVGDAYECQCLTRHCCRKARSSLWPCTWPCTCPCLADPEALHRSTSPRTGSNVDFPANHQVTSPQKLGSPQPSASCSGWPMACQAWPRPRRAGPALRRW